MDKSKLTPMMKQYFDIKDKYEDYILFYRLGDFYEMFFDDAVIASKALEITLTGRNCGLEERAPLCGIPHHSAPGYIEKLIKKGYKVAICEQVEDPSTAKGLVKRDVVRVVTPGTVIDPEMLEEGQNNYLMSIFYHNDSEFAASYADVTTGEFRSFAASSMQKLLDEVSKVDPGEIIISDDLLEKNTSLYDRLRDYSLTVLGTSYFRTDKSIDSIIKAFKVFSIEAVGLGNESRLLQASGALIQYITETQKVDLSHFNNIEIYSLDDFMIVDRFTRRNLEITETIRDMDKKGSLLSILDKTSTSMGSRKLKSCLLEPMLKKDSIDKRLDAVEMLYDEVFAREELKSLLNNVYDMERLSSKLVYGNINPRDMISLKNSLLVIPDIKRVLHDLDAPELVDLNNELDSLEDVYGLIEKAIIDDPPISLKDGGVIKGEFDEELFEIRYALENGRNWLIEIEENERSKTGIKTLKVSYNKVFGYYIEVSKGNAGNAPDHYIRKQTLANCERFITPELKEIEEKILGAHDKGVILETAIFADIRNACLEAIERLLKTARGIALLDVLISFAEVAEKNQYVKPTVENDGRIDIRDGRHPVVERISETGSFVPNDAYLDNDGNLIYIITGPNMAGKSTYLRQVALITLMAQIGSFVPASKANIGIVDRIFTRVGASDDLSSGQSTFMVEMNELANILKNSTNKSLILLDEIGRGTSTYDGLSIAWATVEYISNESGVKAKTMFATHYHELTELEGKFKGVKNFRISVEENSGDIVFLRKIARGGASRSYGIEVAKLAGVPEKVIEIAKKVLKSLEENDINNNIQSILATTSPGVTTIQEANEPQLNFFVQNDGAAEIVELLQNIEILNMTPMEAMNILDELSKKSRQF